MPDKRLERSLQRCKREGKQTKHLENIDKDEGVVCNLELNFLSFEKFFSDIAGS